MEAKVFTTAHDGKEATAISVEGRCITLVGEDAEFIAEFAYSLVSLINAAKRDTDGLPRSAEEAAKRAEMLMIPAAFAQAVYLQADGRNWRDGSGQHITKFGSYLKHRWIKEQARWMEDQKDGSKKESVWNIQQRLTAVRDALRPFTDSDHLKYDSLRGPDGRLTVENYAKLQALRKQEKELNEKLIGI